jgi:hypothetical protein
LPIADVTDVMASPWRGLYPRSSRISGTTRVSDAAGIERERAVGDPEVRTAAPSR